MDAGKPPRFTVFGSVTMNGELPGRDRDRWLLALLLVQVNRVVGIDTVINAFWGERPPRSARNQVKNSAGRLRKVLAAEPDVALLTVGSGYQLVANPLCVDLHRALYLGRRSRYEPSPAAAADLLGQALALWREPVLADVRNERIHDLVWLQVGEDLADLLVPQERLGVGRRG